MFSFGAACIILSFTLEGMRRAGLLIRRRQLLLEFVRLCKWMEREAVDRRATISEMVNTQKDRESLLNEFLKHIENEITVKPFDQVWKETVYTHSTFSCLKKEDIKWIEKISHAFNHIHLESLEKELKFITSGLQSAYDDACDNEGKYVKIYRTLGFMTGLIAVLLLI
ncbi:stage III sporulation protein AB [Jeotgalibacillus terrae]|uniref:Stage III sporulation protein AB n=1 Tax=Jeotgalibacillus terrae TaxID=587735 RepID=A0ABW5ZKU6_9BACL|nr:stage III sporulation protein AB [Jeotgalibacillus terrae]MBM7577557.1 stage III sporulation protein AB [Jeotgalibacillus terrae]